MNIKNLRLHKNKLMRVNYVLNRLPQCLCKAGQFSPAMKFQDNSFVKSVRINTISGPFFPGFGLNMGIYSCRHLT